MGIDRAELHSIDLRGGQALLSKLHQEVQVQRRVVNGEGELKWAANTTFRPVVVQDRVLCIGSPMGSEDEMGFDNAHSLGEGVVLYSLDFGSESCLSEQDACMVRPASCALAVLNPLAGC
eukprot:498666-Rhodomonas_salina.3